MVVPTSMGGDTSGVQVPFSVYYCGNRTKGTFDLTKKTLADFFGTRLVFNETAYRWVEQFLAHYPRGTMNAYNKSQAELPEDCTLLRNVKGTASGMWFEQGGTAVIKCATFPPVQLSAVATVRPNRAISWAKRSSAVAFSPSIQRRGAKAAFRAAQ